MYLIILSLLLPGFLLCREIPPFYEEEFKNLKSNTMFLKFYVFTWRLKQAGFTADDCIENFVNKKRKKALEFYNPEQLTLLEHELAEAKKKRATLPLDIKYPPDIPLDLKNMIHKTIEETSIRGDITISWSDEETSVIKHVCVKKINNLFNNTWELQLKKHVFLDTTSLDSLYGLLRHEAEHIKEYHGPTEHFYILLDKKNSKEKKAIIPTLKQFLRIKRSHETAADLLPLIKAPLSTIRKNEEFYKEEVRKSVLSIQGADACLKNVPPSPEKERVERDKKKLENCLRNSSEDHPSEMKRLKRFTVIRKLKEAEIMYDKTMNLYKKSLDFYEKSTQYLVTSICIFLQQLKNAFNFSQQCMDTIIKNSLGSYKNFSIKIPPTELFLKERFRLT